MSFLFLSHMCKKQKIFGKINIYVFTKTT
ncbi:hypothetical protein PK35_gp42 [Geobacillus phage vB_GthS_PK3.5]|nr:hypothetical protein PK35_gp42 [Geobacillus phage vB_GthS_PK3.5]